MTKEIETFIKKLYAIANQEQPSLQKEVALEALDYDEENIQDFFEDLQKYGCISGKVSSLIYYSDTEEFFDKYYDEIMELKINFEEMTGQPMSIPYHLKNHLAWFSFEETARIMWENF